MMGKLRVYELAKELNVKSNDLVVLLQRLGVDAKNHMSVVEDAVAQQLLQRANALKTKSKAAAPIHRRLCVFNRKFPT